MYTSNDLLSHPLVSPIMQPTLGGLPPLLIMVGGGEVLRDEQIYLAHKCAHPEDYLPPPHLLGEAGKAQIAQYKATDVQLQVWDDLCHVAPTLSFTSPAKFMYRSVAQFSAWALARAQKTGIEIMDDDQISIVSHSDGEKDRQNSTSKPKQDSEPPAAEKEQERIAEVGKAGDPLPRFKDHMIRHRVTRHGAFYELEPASELPACTFPREQIGVVKASVTKKWLAQKMMWDTRYAKQKTRVHSKIIKDMAAGFQDFGEGEYPPPSALAGRRRADAEMLSKKKTRSVGLLIWSLWGSKHDEMTVEREQKADDVENTEVVTQEQGAGARPFEELEEQQPPAEPVRPEASRTRSRRRTVVDEDQTGDGEGTPAADLAALRKEAKEKEPEKTDLLSPDAAKTGISGRRVILNGEAMPFSVEKDVETSSMLTLTSVQPDRTVSPMAVQGTGYFNMDKEAADKKDTANESGTNETGEKEKLEPETDKTIGRAPLERFVTAGEGVPQVMREDREFDEKAGGKDGVDKEPKQALDAIT